MLDRRVTSFGLRYAGIGWHKDKPQFGVIVGVSLVLGVAFSFVAVSTARIWRFLDHVVFGDKLTDKQSDSKPRRGGEATFHR
jgi:hypothetical protein